MCHSKCPCATRGMNAVAWPPLVYGVEGIAKQWDNTKAGYKDDILYQSKKQSPLVSVQKTTKKR